MGKDHDNRLKLAVDYLKFLGTADMSPSQKEKEFYKLGCDLSVNCGSDKIQVTLSGLANNFDESWIDTFLSPFDSFFLIVF